MGPSHAVSGTGLFGTCRIKPFAITSLATQLLIKKKMKLSH